MSPSGRAFGKDASLTEDVKEFGENAWIYCSQHLRPHQTGWCTVPARDKRKLDATTESEAYEECKRRRLKLYRS